MDSGVFKKALRSAIADERGATLALAAMGMGIGAVVVGMAVDMSRYTQTKSQFRNAVDQALLAVASSPTDPRNSADMNRYARQYLDANFTRVESGAKVTELDISYDPAKNEWSARAEGTSPTSFAKLLGVSKLDLKHEAKVAWDEVTTEVVFAVDVSASMCATFNAKKRDEGILAVEPDPKCAKLTKMREALEYIVSGGSDGWNGLPALTTRDGRPAYKVGIVPFNHKVKYPDLNQIPEPVERCELTDKGGDKSYFKVFQGDPGAAETPDFPLPPIAPLVALKGEGDRTKLEAQIAKLKTRHDVPGWTRSNLGMLAAGLMLDPAYKSSYPGGAEPAPIGAPRNEKVIFLLTDGANMGCCYSSHPTGNFDNQYLYTYRTDNEHMSGPEGNPAEGLCGSLKAKGYKVYTIVYDVQDQDARGAGATIKKILSDCASGPEGEFYFDLDVTEGEKIKAAYKTIAQSLMRLRLSY